MKRLALLCACVSVLLVAGCSSGPVRRVSEPTASIQQLTVKPDGGWSVDLRLQNYSSIPMRFDAVTLVLGVDGQPAGTLQGNAGISIGPESADVITLAHAPSAEARIAIANALSDRRGVAYVLEGSLQTVPDGKSARRFDEIKHSSALSPVPGLPGVLR
ncbi:MAG: LEA type 2 family protein [Luteimonas sp.]